MASNIVTDILNLALDREKKGHYFYVQAAKTTMNEKGRQMFQWLASVEQGHIDKLARQVESYARTGRSLKVETIEKKRVTASELPPLPEASGKVTTATREIEALELAMKAEEEAIALYTKASKDLPDPEAATLLGQLALDEQEHLAILSEEHNWLKNSGVYFTLHRFSLTG